jgi:hypothetical protein
MNTSKVQLEYVRLVYRSVRMRSIRVRWLSFTELVENDNRRCRIYFVFDRR